MKEYYCLLLNNCYDKGTHWVCSHRISVLPNVLDKEIKDLESLEQEFMNLDDTIIQSEEGYRVLGSFPVLAEIWEDGKMHDIITGKKLTYTENPKEVNGLSYRAAYRAYDAMAEEILTLLDDEARTRYMEALLNLENSSKKAFHNANTSTSYWALKLKNAKLTPNPVIAKEVNGGIIDVITKERIYPEINGSISSKLSAPIETMFEITEDVANQYQIRIIDEGLEKYLNQITAAKLNSVKKYNNYVSLAKEEPIVKSRNK